eukprot:scaffold187217_cov17-Tisochrysis_lutea.AAC.1
MHEQEFEGCSAPAGHRFLCVIQACPPRASTKSLDDHSSCSIMASTFHIKDVWFWQPEKTWSMLPNSIQVGDMFYCLKRNIP